MRLSLFVAALVVANAPVSAQTSSRITQMETSCFSGNSAICDQLGKVAQSQCLDGNDAACHYGRLLRQTLAEGHLGGYVGSHDSSERADNSLLNMTRAGLVEPTE